MSQKGLASNKTREINRTYVISACKNIKSSPAMLRPDCKLTLQRRETSKGSPHVEVDKNINNQDGTERRLTLQRRLRTGSIEKGTMEKITEEEDKLNYPTEQQNVKSELKSKGFEGVSGKPACLNYAPNVTKPQSLQDNGMSEEVSKFKTTKGSIGTKVNDKGNGLGKLGQDVKTPITKNISLDQQKTPRTGASGLARSSSTRDIRSPLTPKRLVGTLPSAQRKITSTVGSLHAGQTEKLTSHALPSDAVHIKDETVSFHNNLEDDPIKAENCAVTVAVRVRPFSSREINEKASQVVFMKDQETSVQHPDSKQSHSFHYDFSFWSFEKTHPSYADQKLVYEKLAVPLLEWSLLGYNTCLFAYGQTGSGKSYTMMGFDGEPGIIPRFCADLFSRIQTTIKHQFSFHLEMSYFEVYNEKIHDLLVFKADNGQKKQPLRVREHPLIGPFVEDLSTNVVSSFQDIQSWLELGNKQRATAATGMNDKSSRSHSVFTLVMTQTKTELVEGAEHDHRITSRINLVDLAGSERCSSAQTSGERLKEGVSINKSLLTLGKVISSLSENSQTRKKTFIPYRESVLTWLLKESLGGNSKTAMIATVSPANSHVEETLSTLRYARQARLIINIAKVNEDMNAKLIRELKLEIEKLKASQLLAKNTDTEKYRRCQQEMTSLKLKLSQQEREMSELRKAWKEKLEQAEQRKKEETQELQKAGITFKMDNRLPNLVNLNEDPQLSEMLLYMIKEGQTTVGKYREGSSHDIQLSGALIAEDHCVITNIENTVRITPSGEAKTYVNGHQISELTVLHHGDRVILGGDHYFRFNHPVEVQKLKTQSQISTLSSECPKDFEFAKNELLTAQRSQLEEEIEEARLRAKEEMMRGIQIAKEMAQQELTSQKSAYEEKIKALEKELKEEGQRKRQQEVSNRQAVCKIQELEEVKMHLQQEVQLNKRRLEMETLATRQALQDHTMRHAKILQALEAEKQKIAREVQMLQQERNNRDKNPTWNSMKLSVMIQEANTISGKLKKHTVFSRHDAANKENMPENAVQIQVKNLKLGIVTFWNLEKFEYKLAAMKELYESNCGTKDDDIFYDPGDEWEPDLSNSSVSSFSRRRSLMKNRRISGCLYEIRVHPIQSLQSGHSSGLMMKSNSFLSKSSICSNPSDSHLPGICKDLIGSALDYLGQSYTDESNMADSLINNVRSVYVGVHTVSQAYEQQDEDSKDTLFLVNREAQSHCVQLTCAFQQLVVLTKHWLDQFPGSQETSKSADNLSLYIKKLGGYIQLLLQGCCSDIPSMVTEAKDKAGHIAEQILQSIGHLVALTDSELHLQDESKDKEGLQLCEIPRETWANPRVLRSHFDLLNTLLFKPEEAFDDLAFSIAERCTMWLKIWSADWSWFMGKPLFGPEIKGARSFSSALGEGLQTGLQSLTEAALKTTDEMQKDVQRCIAQDEVLTEIKKNSITLASFLQKCLEDCKKLDVLLHGSVYSVLNGLTRELHNLRSCMDRLRLSVVSVLKGSVTDIPQVFTSLNDMAESASKINRNVIAFSPQIISLSELKMLSDFLTSSVRRRHGDGPSLDGTSIFDPKLKNIISEATGGKSTFTSTNPKSTKPTSA
ncbi:kinesin-like protein KIF14 [Rhinophrynus dorsalis]